MAKTGLTVGCARDTYVRRGTSSGDGDALVFHTSDAVRATPTLVAASRKFVKDDMEANEESFGVSRSVVMKVKYGCAVDQRSFKPTKLHANHENPFRQIDTD
eukprot:scaffold5538_cov159-Amphora_coffeaeformis.AAC.4